MLSGTVFGHHDNRFGKVGVLRKRETATGEHAQIGQLREVIKPREIDARTRIDVDLIGDQRDRLTIVGITARVREAVLEVKRQRIVVGEH